MLPEIGTAERDRLEEEALRIGFNAIIEADGLLTDALYRVYQYFREKFIEDYGLMDRAPSGELWKEALLDARRLERYVSECWATDITTAYEGRLRL